MSKRKVIGLFGVMWAAAVVLSAPVMAAAPAGYSEENIGAPDEAGSVTVTGDKWAITGAGNDFNGATEDQLFFVYKNVRGDGSVQARLLGPENADQYYGIMIRASLDANAPMAGLIESTSALNWFVRPAADEAAVRTSGAATERDKLTLLNTSGPQLDTFYFDNAASDTPLRSLSYVVAPVFKAADGKNIEGPAVRAR